MRKIRFACLLTICMCASLLLSAQNNPRSSERLKVFIDCSNTWCDMTYFRTEINIIDFLLDNQAADVHVLITNQGTGGGGIRYQLIFFGQNAFKQMHDTIPFNTNPNGTDFENRDLLLKYLKLGLAPYIAKTNAARDVTIEFKKPDNKDQPDKSKGETTKDPWNYWVYRVSVNGGYQVDENYKNSNFNGELSASRVTEELKTAFELSGGKNKGTYYEEADSLGNRPKTINKNDNYEFQHFLIKSMGEHWSSGYEATLSRSTFSNNKSQFFFRTGIEYAIFPYKEVNTKFFTISYTVDVRRNTYFDTTLYEKTKETLFGHSVESNLSFKQKWGNISFGLQYHNYLHNWKYFSLGGFLELNIRITGGLSFNIYSDAGLTRDQLFLPKGSASLTDILIRRRQLASGYNYHTSFGISYRFGSKLNNFVNPRFDN